MADPTQADIEGHGSDLWPETTKKPVEKVEKTLEIQYVSGAIDYFKDDLAKRIWDQLDECYRKELASTGPIRYEKDGKTVAFVLVLANIEAFTVTGL
jgi:hypothetical protein